MLGWDVVKEIERAQKKFHDNDERTIICPMGPAGIGHKFKTRSAGLAAVKEQGMTKEAYEVAKDKAKFEHKCPECFV